MDFSILYAIQSMRTPVFDKVMLAITDLMGSYGQIWLLAALGLILFRQTRKAGICVLLSYILVLIVGHVVLKDLIARPRPCHIDQSIQLLVARPESFSCPSTHTGWAFAGASSIFFYHKKAGIAAFIIAAIMGFSRMYVFVHFPTDVLLGIVLGMASAYASKLIIQRYEMNKK